MSDEHGWELVMPFVVVRSEGGPYDDASFVAGWDAAVIDCFLVADRPAECTFDVREPLVPQVDLIAMKRGYSSEVQAEVDVGKGRVRVLLTRGRA